MLSELSSRLIFFHVELNCVEKHRIVMAHTPEIYCNAKFIAKSTKWIDDSDNSSTVVAHNIYLRMRYWPWRKVDGINLIKCRVQNTLQASLWICRVSSDNPYFGSLWRPTTTLCATSEPCRIRELVNLSLFACCCCFKCMK